MTRRITITLAIALETNQDVPAAALADVLAEEIELFMPSVCVASDRPVGEWPCATVTRVAVARTDEQQEAAA